MEGNTSSIHLEVCLNRITLRMVFTLLYLAAWQGRRELVRARVLFFNSYSLVNKTFFYSMGRISKSTSWVFEPYGTDGIQS